MDLTHEIVWSPPSRCNQMHFRVRSGWAPPFPSVSGLRGGLHSRRRLPRSFEAENGIKQEAAGELRTVGDADVMVMSGFYEYTGADGELYRVNWYADETGYHAEAEHLPRDGGRHVIPL